MARGINEYKNGYDFYKDSETDQIWQVDNHGQEGPYLFSFDQKTVFNFWTDYPDKLTLEQIEIFKKENPTMAELKIKTAGGSARSGQKKLPESFNSTTKYQKFTFDKFTSFPFLYIIHIKFILIFLEM